jgi:ferredoxin
MPKIFAQGQEITCPIAVNLRQLLLQHNIDLYNGNAKLINCHGIGTCGTCAVEISGELASANWREQARCALPPHRASKGRRLACQIQVTADLEIHKYNGFWGEGDQLIW